MLRHQEGLGRIEGESERDGTSLFPFFHSNFSPPLSPSPLSPCSTCESSFAIAETGGSTSLLPPPSSPLLILLSSNAGLLKPVSKLGLLEKRTPAAPPPLSHFLFIPSILSYPHDEAFWRKISLSFYFFAPFLSSLLLILLCIPSFIQQQWVVCNSRQLKEVSLRHKEKYNIYR